MINFLKNLIGVKEFDKYDAKPSPFAAPKKHKQHHVISNLRHIPDTGLMAKDVLVATGDNSIILETTIVKTQSQVRKAVKEGYGADLTDEEKEIAAQRKIPLNNLVLIKPYWMKDFNATKIFREANTEMVLSSIQRALSALNVANGKRLG